MVDHPPRYGLLHGDTLDDIGGVCGCHKATVDGGLGGAGQVWDTLIILAEQLIRIPICIISQVHCPDVDLFGGH
jgi:hypothetical protein